MRDDPRYFNSPNILPEPNEPCPDAVWSIPLSNSLLYRPPESIASLSSPSSGSRLSSECSPSSSPVPSLADSVTGKSDSDIENEFWKTEPNLQIGDVSLSDVPSCSAQSVNNRSPNKLVTSSVTCGHSCYSLAPESYTCVQPSQLAIRLPPVQPVQPLITVQSVQLANRAVSGQSTTSMQFAEPARHLQPALPVQPAQPPARFQPAQPVRDIQQAQPAVSVRQTQLVPPAISVHRSSQNIPLASSTNTQTVILRSNVPPIPYMPSHPPNIQQGPVIPETVAVSARERIAAKVDKAMKDLVVMALAKLPDDQLSRGDEHGDT